MSPLQWRITSADPPGIMFAESLGGKYLPAMDKYIETKIYSRTDIFSDPRLQRSKRGYNSAKSSEQQDMQALG